MMKTEEIKKRSGTYGILKPARKDIRLSIRVSKEEREFLQTIADAKGVSLSNFILTTIYTSLDTTN